MHLRYPAAAAAAIVGLALATGCKDTNILQADLPVVTDTLVAYALSGTSASLPSGLSLTIRSTVRVDGTGSFDVGFDFDSAGRVVVSPVRVLVNQLSGAPQVGIQTLFTTPYDSIKSAPGGYYRPDTAIVVLGGPAVRAAREWTDNGELDLYLRSSADPLREGRDRQHQARPPHARSTCG